MLNPFSSDYGEVTEGNRETKQKDGSDEFDDREDNYQPPEEVMVQEVPGRRCSLEFIRSHTLRQNERFGEFKCSSERLLQLFICLMSSTLAIRSAASRLVSGQLLDNRDLLHTLRRLDEMEMDMHTLKSTGVGATVDKLRCFNEDDSVRELAAKLLDKWRPIHTLAAEKAGMTYSHATGWKPKQATNDCTEQASNKRVLKGKSCIIHFLFHSFHF